MVNYLRGLKFKIDPLPTVFMYKFDWLNANGNIDTSTSIWKTVTINGQEVKTLEDVDIRGSAEDFRILLKSK